ncbi:MAG TPA: hypothetical protein VM577_10990 [Anaerovoracaceae bacterium]|nr:hypothetical protein [Anaerovoracaceae bacterium]
MSTPEEQLKRYIELKHLEGINPATLNTSPKDTSKEAKHKREQMLQCYEYIDLKIRLRELIAEDEYQPLITTGDYAFQTAFISPARNLRLLATSQKIESMTPEEQMEFIEKARRIIYKDVHEEKEKLEHLFTEEDTKEDKPAKKVKL